jgi:hypothetical protein
MKSTAAMLLHGLRLNVLAGIQLATFLPVNRHDFRVSPGDFAVLAAFNLLIWLAGGMLRGGFPGYVNFSALPVALAEMPLTLCAGLVVATLYRRRELLLGLAVPLISSELLFEIAASAIVIAFRHAGADFTPAAQIIGYLAYLAWVLAIVLRSLLVAAGWRKPQFVYGALLLTGLFLFLVNIMPRTELWAPDSEDAGGTRPAQASILQEEVFHAQGGLLDARLAAIEAERPGKADLYFLGFAPFGSQDVFAKEALTVLRLMQERFDTAGRSLLLANDPATLRELPIASVTNLRASLGQLGRVMDTEEDVLFLFISTHGSENRELAVELQPLQLAQLTPTALARMLHDSGIKWKVLVISACYSGGYIEPLKDDNTLIITATDAANTSFGCENGRDFTYFGKAYFDEALRRTKSFAGAFEQAKQAVAERERAEKLTPSNPQMHVGAAIKDKLAVLQQRLEKRQ